MQTGEDMQFIFTDHLGSIAAVTDTNGDLVTEKRYLPFGGARLDPLAETDFSYTCKRPLDDIGLMDYHAR